MYKYWDFALNLYKAFVTDPLTVSAFNVTQMMGTYVLECAIRSIKEIFDAADKYQKIQLMIPPGLMIQLISKIGRLL